MEIDERKNQGAYAAPTKLEGLNISFQGRSYPTWLYKEIPEDMRLAKSRDIYMGRMILYRVMIGSHKNYYYTAVVTPANIDSILYRIDSGSASVYVKDNKYR